MEFLSRGQIYELPIGMRVKIWRACNQRPPAWTAGMHHDVIKIEDDIVTLRSHRKFSLPVTFSVDDLDGTDVYGLTY